MHRTQILLEDEQYQRLLLRSKTSGQGIGELVRRAVDQVYGSSSVPDQLLAVAETSGAVGEEGFDGRDGRSFVDLQRRGLGRRHDQDVDDRR